MGVDVHERLRYEGKEDLSPQAIGDRRNRARVSASRKSYKGSAIVRWRKQKAAEKKYVREYLS